MCVTTTRNSEDYRKTFQKSLEKRQIEIFIIPPKRLNNMITTKEVTKAVQKMANNKAPGKDNINLEVIKYTPEEVHQEISKILNGIFETNNEEIKLGTGVLLPLPKPKKTQEPMNILRPMTLLEVIRKIISKIFKNRTEDKINRYLSQ